MIPRPSLLELPSVPALARSPFYVAQDGQHSPKIDALVSDAFVSCSLVLGRRDARKDDARRCYVRTDGKHGLDIQGYKPSREGLDPHDFFFAVGGRRNFADTVVARDGRFKARIGQGVTTDDLRLSDIRVDRPTAFFSRAQLVDIEPELMGAEANPEFGHVRTVSLTFLQLVDALRRRFGRSAVYLID